MVRFDAHVLSTAWLAAGLASGKNAAPVLDNTLLVETFPEGVRLVGTDGHMLLTAWAPTEDDEFAAEPAVDDAAVSQVVVMDPDGRARQFMAYLHKLTADEDGPQLSVRFGVAARDEDGAFEGMAATWATLEYPDHEKLTLRCFEGEYPNWRALVAAFTEKRTSAIALNPELLGRLAKLGKLGGTSLVWRWGGHDKAAQVELEGTTIRGLVMPMRSSEVQESEAA